MILKIKKKVPGKASGKNSMAADKNSEKRMFSAASFFDVIDAVSEKPSHPLAEPTTVPQRPATVAFYGFRGGAGRTLALAHVAMMLAQRGLRIAMVDADIEAPGLHVALGAKVPEDSTGLVALLSRELTSDADSSVKIGEHIQVVTPTEGSGKILLLPAGRVTRRYLAQIEELGVGMWHEPDVSPLERVLNGLKQENPDVVFIDCRTGFSGMSASILFHLSDLAVIFLPLSDQVWDGVDVLLEAAAASRGMRKNSPALLFVHSMIPTGETGRVKNQRHINKIREKYNKWLNIKRSDEQEEDAELDGMEPWLREGIVWDPRISSDGAVRQPFMPGGPWGIFQSLFDKIVATIDLQTQQPLVEPVQIKGILDELQIKGSDGFAEELDAQQMKRLMVPSDSVRAAIDRTSALVIGAKGSGKTLLWRILVGQKADGLVRLPHDTKYVVGHAPTQELDPQGLTLSADALKELEAGARMRDNSTYKAFWILYGLFRLSKSEEIISNWISVNIPKTMRLEWKKLIETTGSPDFSPLLGISRISTQTEDLLAGLDTWLANNSQQYVLVFDGLDSGFQTGKPEAWYTRRERFVTGLLQVVAEWRSRLKRVQFKIFLREDIYLSIELQNRSHLDAAKHELRFGTIDLWQLALKIASTSQTYRSAIMHAKMGPDGLYVGDENELRTLLYPLWGRTVEKGKQAYTANYILKRTSDAQHRLFPRTFIQMLDAAIKFELKSGSRTETDRVLRFKALQDGVAQASKQRVEDLRTEYVELKPYLEALRGAPAVATAEKLIAKMKPNIGKPALSLHMGAGGWQKVLDRLVTVGVMGKKTSETGEEDKLSVALLYRGGLGLKSAGLK